MRNPVSTPTPGPDVSDNHIRYLVCVAAEIKRCSQLPNVQAAVVSALQGMLKVTSDRHEHFPLSS